MHTCVDKLVESEGKGEVTPRNSTRWCGLH